MKLSNSQKDKKNKTCRYYGKPRHVEKTYWKKRIDLEEKVWNLEGDVITIRSTSQLIDDFTFNVETSQALLDQTSHNEWVIDYVYTHHMAKDASLLSSLDVSNEKKIYVSNNFALNIVGQDDISCQHGQIVDVYHVPSLSANILFISQLTQTGKIVEF